MLVIVVMKPYICLLQWHDTALHEAASRGRCDVLQLLIDAGMAVDTKNTVSWYNDDDVSTVYVLGNYCAW